MRFFAICSWWDDDHKSHAASLSASTALELREQIGVWRVRHGHRDSFRVDAWCEDVVNGERVRKDITTKEGA